MKCFVHWKRKLLKGIETLLGQRTQPKLFCFPFEKGPLYNGKNLLSLLVKRCLIFNLHYCIKKAVPHVINSRALTSEKPCINKAIQALLMHGYATFNMLVPGPRFAAVTRCVLPGLRTSIVHGNYVRETSVKRRNEIVQEITRNVANVFSFYAIITTEHGFQCINIRQVSREVLKTAASGLGFQHLPRDLANVNA